MKSRFSGLGVALITPFDKNLAVDVPALKRVVRHVIDGGADFLVVLGTTSEAPTMTLEEKQLVLDTVYEENAKALPIVLGMGGYNTQEVINNMNHYDLDKVDAFLSVVPYYNKPSQAGIMAHFNAIAAKSAKPIILYNVPGRTVTNMNAVTTLAVAEANKNVFAIKEASGNMAQGMELIKDRSDDFIVLSGDDDLVMPQVAMGFDGVISVIGNSHPRAFKDMIEATKAGDLAKAQKIHYELLPLIGHLFEEGNPAGIKNTLKQMGICGDEVRLPLVSASENLAEKISQYLKA